MERILYYVDRPDIECVEDAEQVSGWKTVTIYTIEENVPKQFFSVDCDLYDNPEEVIQEYLDDNGYGDETFKMVQL